MAASQARGRRSPKPEGFVSAEARTGLQRAAAVGGGVLLLLLALAYAAFMAVALLQAGDPLASAKANAYGVALRPGQAWYLASAVPGPAGRARVSLMAKAGQGPARAMASLDGDLDDQFLLDQPAGRLWVISQEHCGDWDGRAIRWIPAQPRWKDISRPFVLKGAPAVMVQEAGQVTVWRLQGRTWKPEDRFQFSGPAGFGEGDCSCRHLRLTVWNGQYQWFYKDGARLRHHQGRPWGRYLDVRHWRAVCSDSSALNWAPKSLAGGLYLAELHQEGGARQARVWRFEDPSWRAESVPSGRADSVALLDDPDRRPILALAGPGLRLLGLGAAAGPEQRLLADPGLAILLPMAALWCLLIFGPLSLLALLDAMGRRARPSGFKLAGRGVRLAGLWRRCGARVLDELLAWLGGLAAVGLGVALKAWLWPGEMSLPQALAWMGLFLGAYFGAKGLLVLELGRKGRTPGRRAFGIQVLGLDLRPIGAGRSLLRGLFMVVDAFFLGLVGLMVAGLTARQQRLGDLAADSVALRTLEGPPPRPRPVPRRKAAA